VSRASTHDRVLAAHPQHESRLIAKPSILRPDIYQGRRWLGNRLQIGLVAQCSLLVLNQNVLPGEDTGARPVRCARASNAARIQQYAGVGLFRDESWSTRFLASTVSYFIFYCGGACILNDESAPTGSAAPQYGRGSWSVLAVVAVGSAPVKSLPRRSCRKNWNRQGLAPAAVGRGNARRETAAHIGIKSCPRCASSSPRWVPSVLP
jgi:hypothetical protein